jgi:hypothetical protein
MVNALLVARAVGRRKMQARLQRDKILFTKCVAVYKTGPPIASQH